MKTCCQLVVVTTVECNFSRRRASNEQVHGTLLSLRFSFSDCSADHHEGVSMVTARQSDARSTENVEICLKIVVQV